tara:strand:+ start:629 stop:1636 length:1008 start_codon:yes stop_codon:yes gene_type:complete
MTYFNKKFDVLGIELSPYGKHLLQNGKLMPKYYAFFDDDVLYDCSAAGFTENNSEIRNRIINETPVLRPHYMFKTVEDSFVKDQPFPTSQYDNVKRPIADETAKFLQYSLGSSDPTKEKAPAWRFYSLINEISSSAVQLSSSNYQPLNIAQIDYDINYEMSIRNIDDDGPVVGTKGTPNLPMSTVMEDGTYLNLEEEQVLAYILEKNGFLFGESLELEVFMFETTGSGDSLKFTEELVPLKFVKRSPQIVNGILMDEEADTFSFREDGTSVTPQHVEYYWDCRLDKEIPLDDLCKGLAQLKAAGISDDLLDIECPDDIGQASIYGSQVTDIEDCD